jgi:hypothetical protein
MASERQTSLGAVSTAIGARAAYRYEIAGRKFRTTFFPDVSPEYGIYLAVEVGEAGTTL